MVSFHSADRQLGLQQKTAIKTFIASIFKKEKKPLEAIRYVFCSDPYLLQINRDFLQHDYYTDIITFGLSEPGQPIEAEVYISLDRVKENAAKLGIPVRQEILRVLFHGALHLCGYKDKTKAQEKEMRAKEDSYLAMFHVKHSI